MRWKDVDGYEGNYQVSEHGDVRSVDRVVGHRNLIGKELKPSENPDGYLTVTLSARGVRRTRLVHQLVCEAFIGVRPEGTEILHGSIDRKDNSIHNLRYGTRSQNALDRKRDGTQHDVSKEVVRGDGQVFSSLTSAAEASSTTVCNISSVCRGRRAKAGGFS